MPGALGHSRGALTHLQWGAQGFLEEGPGFLLLWPSCVLLGTRRGEGRWGVSRLIRGTGRRGQLRMGGQAPPWDVSLGPGYRKRLPRNPNVITHFLNSLPHPTASSRRRLFPQDPAQAWPMGGAQKDLLSNSLSKEPSN